MKKGDRVTYVTDYGDPEIGIVKSVQSEEKVFVVYNCGGDWKNYKNYTAARTNVRDLRSGWLQNCPECLDLVDKDELRTFGGLCHECTFEQ